MSIRGVSSDHEQTCQKCMDLGVDYQYISVLGTCTECEMHLDTKNPYKAAQMQITLQPVDNFGQPRQPCFPVCCYVRVYIESTIR